MPRRSPCAKHNRRVRWRENVADIVEVEKLEYEWTGDELQYPQLPSFEVLDPGDDSNE